VEKIVSKEIQSKVVSPGVATGVDQAKVKLAIGFLEG
jgi:hypothetical protein